MLRRYQLAAIERGVIGNLLISDECGLGKTAMAIVIGKHLRLTGHDPSWRGLVVHPNKLRELWVDEMSMWDSDAPIYLATDNAPDLKYGGWWLVSYDQMIRAPLSWLQTRMWSLLVADECHRIKNRKTLRAKALKNISAVRKIGLSATPWESDPSNLWSILNWLFPERYKSYWKFVGKYCDIRHNWAGYEEIVGPKNVADLGKELRKAMVRRTKQQVAPELPPRIMVPTLVEMTPAQTKEYRILHASKDVRVDMQENGLIYTVPNMLALLVKLQQISTFPAGVALTAESGKMQWVEEFMADHPNEPMLIFSKFRAPVQYLKDIHPEADLIIGGETTNARRFMEGKTDLLFGTIASMGEGLSLERARYAIFLDQEWSSIKMAQAIDRIHRINIDEPKVIYELYSTKEDRLVLEAIDKKWSDAELVYQFLERSYHDNV